jgi:hypothetical protein
VGNTVTPLFKKTVEMKIGWGREKGGEERDREGRKEGGKEGRKGGRKERNGWRKEQRKRKGNSETGSGSRDRDCCQGAGPQVKSSSAQQ